MQVYKKPFHLHCIAVIGTAFSCDEVDPFWAKDQETLKRCIRGASLQRMTQLKVLLFKRLRALDRRGVFRHVLDIENLMSGARLPAPR